MLLANGRENANHLVAVGHDAIKLSLEVTFDTPKD
jgi:hypothetical protein